MNDGFGRELDYLRISVTDRCNLQCSYCIPQEEVHTIPYDEILTYDEIVRVVRILAKMGVTRLRLTGGEPLVRQDLPLLAERLKRIRGIEFLGLTTNGVLLEEMAEALFDAGVDGVNLNLDTAERYRYTQLTKRDEWPRVWRSIQKALSLPFRSVKINYVLAPDSKVDDWFSVVALAKDHPLDIRLIEWIPYADEYVKDGVLSDKAMQIIRKSYVPLTPLDVPGSSELSHYWKAKDFKGRIVLIPFTAASFVPPATACVSPPVDF
ncbi:radical SAM protein [Ruminococcaceae bacterium OttesenSCG-928-I18]|nr:radical SAM protein [Ruminococcaceae bacterium OttesenSCG-928-I18]